eukprot:1146914-Pelagomonas_calceolata.AAC.16
MQLGEEGWGRGHARGLDYTPCHVMMLCDDEEVPEDEEDEEQVCAMGRDMQCSARRLLYKPCNGDRSCHVEWGAPLCLEAVLCLAMMLCYDKEMPGDGKVERQVC